MNQPWGQLHLQAGAVERAMQAAQRAAALNPALANAHHLLSQCLDKLGKTDQALETLARALALNPTVPAWHLQSSNLHVKQGQHHLALQAAQTAISLDPENPRAKQQMQRVSPLAAALQQSEQGNPE